MIHLTSDARKFGILCGACWLWSRSGSVGRKIKIKYYSALHTLWSSGVHTYTWTGPLAKAHIDMDCVNDHCIMFLRTNSWVSEFNRKKFDHWGLPSHHRWLKRAQPQLSSRLSSSIFPSHQNMTADWNDSWSLIARRPATTRLDWPLFTGSPHSYHRYLVRVYVRSAGFCFIFSMLPKNWLVGLAQQLQHKIKICMV